MRSILDDAKEIIYGDRERTYGRPEFNLTSIAEFWRLYLERKHNVLVALMPADVAYMMVLLKLARLMNQDDHRDSQVDAVGYMALIDRIQREQTAQLMETQNASSTEGGS
jgi:prophage DNA circulation protein